MKTPAIDSNGEVFLSFVPADRERVKPLARALWQSGWTPVWDRSDPTAIDRARCVIVLWSESSVGSELVRAEAQRGFDRQILLPVLLDDVQMPPPFQAMRATRLVGWDGGEHWELNALIGAATLLARPPASTGKPGAIMVPAGFPIYMGLELCMQIAYCGPTSAAKTNSLKHLYDSTSPERRGNRSALQVEGQPHLFDLFPLDLGRFHGFKLRLRIMVVPAEEYYVTLRKLTLGHAVGVVFVADASADRIDDNLAALSQLRGVLADCGIEYEEMPLVFQYDGPARPDPVVIDRLRSRLNDRGAPEMASLAAQGVGVLETLRTLVRMVLLRSNYEERAPLARGVTKLPD